MTVDTYRPYIGRTATADLAGLGVHVRVLDIRSAFGRIDAQVTPIAGTGQCWVAFARLTFTDGATHCHVCSEPLDARERKRGMDTCYNCEVEALQ